MTPAELACASGIKREELEAIEAGRGTGPRQDEGSASNLAVLVMSYADINRVVLVGRLHARPRAAGPASRRPTVCGLRIACNSVRKDGDVAQERPNYFDVYVFGAQEEDA